MTERNTIVPLPNFIRLCLSQTRALNKEKANFVSNLNIRWDLPSSHWVDIPDSITGCYMEIAGVTVIRWTSRQDHMAGEHDNEYFASFIAGVIDLPILVAFVRRPFP